MSEHSPTIYLIAGEASGDLLGAGLMREIKNLCGEMKPRFIGIGGERMEAEGMASLFPYHQLSLMGLAEIIPHFWDLRARIEETVADILAKQPDVVVTIDSPGFNKRVVKRLRAHGVKHTKFVHYVAPSVWAYNAKRAKTMAELFDHLLALLPFEPPYFTREGLPCTFVGHPVAARVFDVDGQAFREKHKIEKGPVITLLPGSRVAEIRRHMEPFARAVALLAECYKDLTIIVPVSRRLAPVVAPFFEGCPYRTLLVADENEKSRAIAASDIALVKSGTVSVEVARIGTPQIVAYRVHPLTAMIARRIFTTRFVCLVNIMAKKEIIPELLQEYCTAPFLATAAQNLLQSPEAARNQREQAQAALAQLLPENSEMPDAIAARAVLQQLSLK